MNTLAGKRIIIIDPRKIITEVEKNIFATWLETWEDAIQNDLKLGTELYSDEFTRQDEICALYDFDRNKCIGMAFFRYVNFECETSQKDSYFSEWPEEAQKKLIKKGSKIAVCSQFTVALAYRKERSPFKWKDVVMFSIVNHFIYNTMCDSMTGAVRINKSVNTASYSSGATLLLPNVKNHIFNEYEDLVAFYRGDVISYFNQNKNSMFETLITNSFVQEKSA